MSTTIPETSRLNAEQLALLNILRRHPGRHKAISMAALYEAWSGDRIPRDSATGKATVDVPTLTRRMRSVIDELRDIHGIPVMSSTGAGYWIVTTEQEMRQVRHEFRSRGLKSLMTAARLEQVSLVDAVQQLALDLANADSAIHKHVAERKVSTVPRDIGELILSPEARMAVITQHLQELLASPQEYADQIHALQRQFGPRLLPRSVVDALNQQADQVRALARQTIDAADQLQAMVGERG